MLYIVVLLGVVQCIMAAFLCLYFSKFHHVSSVFYLSSALCSSVLLGVLFR